MFDSLRGLGASAYSGRAVDKMVLIAVITEVAKPNAELGQAANTNFVCGVEVRPRMRPNLLQKSAFKLG